MDDLPIDPDEIARRARAELPSIVAEIETLVSTTDPIELLATLTLLFQTGRTDEVPNRDEGAQWQVRIEWLSSQIRFRQIRRPEEPVLIDECVLTPLEALLDRYFHSLAMTLMETDDRWTPEQARLRSLIRTESLFVRGEGYRHHIEPTAVELYSPHDDWCRANLGLTVRDAFALAEAVERRFSDSLHAMRAESSEIRRRVLENAAFAMSLTWPDRVRRVVSGLIDSENPIDEIADTVVGLWMFSKVRDVVGFTSNELVVCAGGHSAQPAVDAFLRLLSSDWSSAVGEVDPFGLSPLAKTPFLRDGERYFLFTPGILTEALFYAFHGKLFADAAYRSTYDDCRARVMEAAGVAAFKRLLPRSETGWGLKYGPKKQRLELDGLVWYDGKLILIECKWKNLQVVARSGDVDAALADIDKAIIQPLHQAQRARQFIRDQGVAVFTETRTGRTITVRSDDVDEVFLVTLVGGGAWAQIAANLPALSPLGLFADREYPWALSLNDLQVVSECLQGLPPLLFDYLRRRSRFQNDPRFMLHDEWDFLGVYLHGALDVDDPRFPSDVDHVTLDAFDSQLQDYYGTRGREAAGAVERPTRAIPSDLLQLLKDVEMTAGRGRTDAICLVLSWSDNDLVVLNDKLKELFRRVRLDGRVHAFAGRHPSRAVGVALACGFENQRGIEYHLDRVITKSEASKGPAKWVGFAVDLSMPYAPLLVTRS